MTQDYGNYGTLLVMGNAGFMSSTVPRRYLRPPVEFRMRSRGEDGACGDHAGSWIE